MAKTVDWSEDVIAELRRHWLAGLSAAAIAKQMGRGLSRTAVIGKARRLKLPGRNVITRKTVDWSEDVIAELRQHWLAGLSAAAIAEQMGRGLSRNAVIGKASRLKLPGRNVITRMSVVRIPRTTSFRAPPKPRAPLQKLPDYQSTPTVDPMECGTIQLTDLEPHQCRFAAGDPAPGEKHLFCGKPTMPSFPYCEAHVQRCYQIDKPRSTRTFYRGLRPLTVANVFVPA